MPLIPWEISRVTTRYFGEICKVKDKRFMAFHKLILSFSVSSLTNYVLLNRYIQNSYISNLSDQVGVINKASALW